MGIEVKDKSFLKWIKKNVYEPTGLLVQNLKIEDESADYGAAEFTINNQRIKFRVGKITPTKIDQFVTFWKRVDKGSIMPYDFNDPFDLLVISVRNENRFGQFIFSKAMLCEKRTCIQRWI